MQVATRRSVLSIGLVVTLLAVAAIVVLPVSAVPSPPDGDLNLHTDADGVTMFSLGSGTQLVENGKGCLIKDLGEGSESLIMLGSTKAKSKPGYVRGIGLKTGGSNGTPCSQVDEDDAGSLVLISATGALWESMTLDLELKQNAKILIEVSGASEPESFLLLTGSSIDPSLDDPDAGFPYEATVTATTSSTEISPGVAYPAVNCANPSDSGPDSGPNDNCRLTIIPDMTFDTVTITALVGSVSLEGGADFVGWPLQDEGVFDSIFVYAPVAADDAASTDEDTPVVIDVLANDIGLDTVTGVSNEDETPGSASLIDGEVRFDPAGEFEALNVGDEETVTFEYSATSLTGTTTLTATVTVTIKGVNDPPEITYSPGSSILIDEDTSATLVAEASDPDTSQLELVIPDGGGPSNGTLALSGTSVTYTPDENYNGSDYFSYRVCEDVAVPLCTDEQAVEVTVDPVNDPPVANADFYVFDDRTASSTTLVVAAPGVLENDSDVDTFDVVPDVLSATLVSGPSSGTLVSWNSDGSFEYDPPPGFIGSATFVYEVSDGELADQTTVTIDVYQVMCSGDSQSDSDGAVFGEFTLLTLGVCKRYDVTADAADKSVTFSLGGGTLATFRGVLRFPGEPVDGSLPLLEYGEGSATPLTMPVCIDPDFDGNDVTGATIPLGHTWCLVSVAAVADEFGNLAPEYVIFGEGDPIFRIK